MEAFRERGGAVLHIAELSLKATMLNLRRCLRRGASSFQQFQKIEDYRMSRRDHARGICATMLLGALTLVATVSQAAGPNPNLKYYGYAWIDGDNVSTDAALTDLSAGGPNKTNMNVVNTVAHLNSSACSSKHCALGISAGVNPTWANICPSATSNAACQAQNSWQNIWTIAGQIKGALNTPAAIYFIDEPSKNKALQDSAGHYVPWQYASYVCTLRQALAANALSTIKVFTVLATGELPLPGVPDDPAYVVKEIRNQMPSSGCPTTVRSTPDWIGIDNYGQPGYNDINAIHARYNNYFPPGGASMPAWVLVPPAYPGLVPVRTGNDDQDLHDVIQVYWDYLFNWPADPIVVMMNFRFSVAVWTDSTTWPQTEALLRFMGNSLTP
jgi:hypothetical protein